MEKIRISAVKYANTYPFIYGLKVSGFEKKVHLETDHPADCASKLINGKVDIGLVPVAIIPQVKNHDIISNYCIGANGKVRTVMLLSNCLFNEIDSINLDYRSRTSVNLAKVLAKNMWEREFWWKNTSEGFDFGNIPNNEAVVLIGDQCFEYENRFRFKIDLAEEWKQFSELPFVFACWVANRELDPGFVKDFNSALELGVTHIEDVARTFWKNSVISQKELKKYLNENIDYIFNEDKKKGMKLFLELLDKL
jgi:chorismate dehydratase